MAIRKGNLSMPKSASPSIPTAGGNRPGIAGKIKEFTIVSTFLKGQQNDLTNLPTTNLSARGSVNVLSCLETTGDMTCCIYTEEYEYICVGFSDGKVRLFKTSNQELSTTFYDKEVLEPRCSVTCLQHRPLGKTHPITNSIIATYLNGCVKCWNYNMNDCSYTIREKRQTYGLAYHTRMPKLLTFGDDAKINYYDEETRTQERVFQASENPNKLDGHSGNIYAAAYNPKSNHEFVTGGWDDTVQFWDTRQPNAVRHITGIHMSGSGLAVNTTGTQLLVCAWQGQHPLQIWDYGAAKLIANIEPDEMNSKLLCGQFVTGDFCVCSGGEPNIIRIFDVKTNMSHGMVFNLENVIPSLSIGPPVKQKKPTKFSATQQEENERPSVIRFNILQALPRIAFISGRKLYQIDFH